MPATIQDFQRDAERLIARGINLFLALQYDSSPAEFRKMMVREHGDDADKTIKELPVFTDAYQSWYSEARSLVKVVLPDRLPDFVRYYEKPKNRKGITFENYSIEDALQGLHVHQTSGLQRTKVVGPDAAIPQLRQQLNIVKSAKSRFNTSLFDIRQVVQADLFDNELSAARELAKKRFTRAAGALAGVVLERHLKQVCENHDLLSSRKTPTIADYNDALKSAEILEVSDWRFIQHLGDLRNLCDHDKNIEPTMEQVDGLISGVDKLTKTLF